jgi:hypothetical protein
MNHATICVGREVADLVKSVGLMAFFAGKTSEDLLRETFESALELNSRQARLAAKVTATVAA